MVDKFFMIPFHFFAYRLILSIDNSAKIPYQLRRIVQIKVIEDALLLLSHVIVKWVLYLTSRDNLPLQSTFLRKTLGSFMFSLPPQRSSPEARCSHVLTVLVCY